MAKQRIIVDGFGGDNAPAEILKGCRMAADELGVQIILTGSAERLRAAAQENQVDISDFEIIGCPDVITMEDEATPAPAVEGGEPFDKTGVNLAPLAAVSAAIAAAGFGCLAVAMKRCREKDAEELGEREIPEIR